MEFSLLQSISVAQISLSLGVRTVAWLFSSFKAYHHGLKGLSIEMIIFGLTTSLFPIFALFFGEEQYIRHTREFAVVASHLCQYYFVGRYYDGLYPCSDDEVTVWRMFTAVISGNGALFLCMTFFAGSILFKWLFIAQYSYLLVLIFNNVTMCAKSPALRQAYTWFNYKCILAVLHRAIDFLNNFGDWLKMHDFSYKSFQAFAQLLGKLHGIGRSSIQHGQLTHEACAFYQLLFQLVFGFWIPCYAAFKHEIEFRNKFLGQFNKRIDERTICGTVFLTYTFPVVILPFLFFWFTKGT